MFNSFTYVIFVTFNFSLQFVDVFFVFVLFFVLFVCFFSCMQCIKRLYFLEKKRSETQQDRIWKGIPGIRDLTEL